MNLLGIPWRKIATFMGLLLLASAPAGAQQPGSAAVLAPGVLVGAADQAAVAWVSDAQGQVAAINLHDGSVRWRAAAEGLPLALHEQRLVVLARPQEAGKLSLLLLNPQDGTALGGVIGELPAGVLATPDPQPNRIFEATAVASSGGLKIRWSYSDWPLRGAKLPTQEPNDGRRELSGVVSVDFAGSRLQAVADTGLPAARTPDLIGAERLANLDGTQFRAADDAHVQVATAVADDVLGTQWRWSVHERNSGRSVGNLVLPYANAPFLLRGDQLLWRSEPMVIRQAAGDYRTYAARLVAQDLASGKEEWSVDLLDRNYKGPLPP